MTDYSKDKFAKDIREQSFPILYNYSTARHERFRSPDSKINAWINKIVLPNKSKYDGMKSYRTCKVVDDGYLNYQDHARYQQDGLQSGQFVEVLVRGLQHLVFLASVTLQSQWPREPHCIRRRGIDTMDGSPLARSWNIFYLKPCGWSFTYDENERQVPDGARHYLDHHVGSRPCMKANPQI